MTKTQRTSGRLTRAPLPSVESAPAPPSSRTDPSPAVTGPPRAWAHHPEQLALRFVTAVVELVLAAGTGSVGLLGDALHNASDVSTSAVVLLGFWVSRREPSPRFPYGYERAEDLAGLGVALVIWISAVFAGIESYRKLVGAASTSHVGWGMAGALLGIAGNLAVARYKAVVGHRIQAATLTADGRHSALDALSSAAALAGLVGVALGYRWADRVAGFAVIVLIAHVGWSVTTPTSPPNSWTQWNRPSWTRPDRRPDTSPACSAPTYAAGEPAGRCASRLRSNSPLTPA